MKKTDFGYAAKWYCIGIAVVVVLLVAMIFTPNTVDAGLAVAAFIVYLAIIAIVPGVKTRTMEKKGAELEKNFQCNFKFTAHNAIFYVDSAGGRLGILWKGNPFEIQLANMAGLTDVRTNDGKMLGGTSLVKCQFRLDGKQYSVHTLRVSRGQMSMKSNEVLEAISKADMICELLNAAKTTALASAR